MVRLIDADALPVSTAYCVDEAGFGAKFDVVYKEDIDKARSIELVLLREPEPEKRGHWIFNPDWKLSKCSECGETGLRRWKRCPYCEAKMEVEA